MLFISCEYWPGNRYDSSSLQFDDIMDKIPVQIMCICNLDDRRVRLFFCVGICECKFGFFLLKCAMGNGCNSTALTK